MVGQTQMPGGYGEQQQHYQQSMPPKTYWALLNDLGQLPEDEIEGFLPQIVNILVEDTFAKSMDYQTYGHLRQILLTKCAGCLPFGMRVCALLEAQSEAPSESIFKVFSGGESNTEAKAERVRYLKQGTEAATFYGNQLPQRVSSLRANYMKDMHTMLEHFSRIGRELKTYPVQHRNYHLRSAVTTLNEMLFNRMLSRGTSLTTHGINLHDLESSVDFGGAGPASSGGIAVEGGVDLRQVDTPPSPSPPPPPPPHSPPPPGANPHFLQHYHQQQQQVAAMTASERAFLPTATTARHVASLCPEVAAYSMHVPLQHCREKVQRLLQFVVSECEILPSKERCPYLLVAEVLEQPFSCKSSELFAQRHPLGLTALDAVQNRGDSLEGLHLRTAGAGTATRDRAVSWPVVEVEEEENHSEGGRELEHKHEMQGGPSVEEKEEEKENTTLPPSSHRAPRTMAEEEAAGGNFKAGWGLNPEQVAAGVEEREEGTAKAEATNVELFARGWQGQGQGQGQGPPTGVMGDLRGGSAPLPSDYGPSSSSNGALEAPHYTQSTPYDPLNALPPYPQYPPPSHGPHSGMDSYPSPQQQQPSPLQGQGQGPPAGFLQKKFVRGTTWSEREAAVQASSPFGHLPGWRLKSFIVKSGDDLRKEMLAQQVLEMMKQVFESARLDIRLTPYQIVPTGASAGLVEFINTARSIDRMKKSSPDVPTLKEYFEYTYGPPYSPRYINAVSNFTRSLVGYSLLTYILQVRDRHNANLLLDDDGSIIHIDFGFILGDSPGMNMNFENAPFKLTREYVELLGGLDSDNMRMFQDLFMRGFFALQQHTEGLAAIVHLFYGEKRKAAADGVRSRLGFAHTQADVMGLMKESIDNWRTKQYDWFQQRSNGILM